MTLTLSLFARLRSAILTLLVPMVFFFSFSIPGSAQTISDEDVQAWKELQDGDYTVTKVDKEKNMALYTHRDGSSEAVVEWSRDHIQAFSDEPYTPPSYILWVYNADHYNVRDLIRAFDRNDEILRTNEDSLVWVYIGDEWIKKLTMDLDPPENRSNCFMIHENRELR